MTENSPSLPRHNRRPALFTAGMPTPGAGQTWFNAGGSYYVNVTEQYVPAADVETAVRLLAALDDYAGHREDCNELSGVPECSCGFDELYARVRAVVREVARAL